MISIGKEKKKQSMLIKNSKGEGGRGEGEKNVWRGWFGKQSEGLGGVVWVYKVRLK